MAPQDLQTLAAFAETLADLSRSIILSRLDEAAAAEIKPDGSPVTAVDRAVEQALRDRIAAAYPDHGVLGEEFPSRNTDAERVWVIDPIDGTKQFVAGLPLYASLIALAERGAYVLGVMDFPATGERWSGGAGLPARHDGKALRTRPCAGVAQALVCAGTPTRGSDRQVAAILRLARAGLANVWGSSAYGFALVASGRVDLAVDCGLDPYDLAAPVAVVEAAGGIACDWQGNPLTLESEGEILLAGDRRALDEAVALLAG